MKLKKYKYKTVNSTNDLAIKIIKNTNTKFGMVIADKQKKGRGQYGKKWTSFKGNLFVSIFFPINKIKFSIKDFTKINCFLVKKLLSNYYKGEIIIKNPNDILINNMKISGILQEKILKSETIFMIVGIGLNLIKSPIIKGYTTTNLLDLTGVKVTPYNANLKLKRIYEKFIPVLPKFNKKSLK